MMANKYMDAMAHAHELNKTHGITQRGGKVYTQVVHRMEAFRSVFGGELGVDTDILVDDGQRVVVKATVTDPDGRTIGSGMAEEIRGQGHVNKTSALENCETSAIGRALASLGLAGGEYASMNEIDAVGRKEQAQRSNQAGAPPSIPSPEGVIPDETPSDAPPESEEDRADKAFYKSMRSLLADMKSVSGVNDLFGKQKTAIQEIKNRRPDRAELILDLFLSREAELKGGK